jgi:hypothetical protein
LRRYEFFFFSERFLYDLERSSSRDKPLDVTDNTFIFFSGEMAIEILDYKFESITELKRKK